MARYAAGQPFQMPQAPVAGFNEDQQSAFANMRRDQGLAQPYMQQAGDYFNQSAQPINPDIGRYLNPFASYVMGGLQDIFGQQRTDSTGRLTQAAGGVGADRIGVAQANLAKQQGLAAGQTLAGIYQPAMQTAVSVAQQDAARQQSAAYGMGQLGTAAQNAALQGNQALLAGGNQQQAQSQAELMAPYNQRVAELEYPFKTAQFLSGINSQTAPGLGGTTTNTYPGQSPWGTIAGLGMTAAGAFSGNPMMMKGGMSALGSGAMGGASQGPMGYGGYQPGMSAGPGFSWMPSPHGPGSMAPMAYGAGGSVEYQDAFRPYQTGGDIEMTQQPDGSFADRFSAVYDDPRQAAINAAIEDDAPLPASASVLPPPPSALPPQITGQEPEMPPAAMGYAPGPQGGPPALPPPMPVQSAGAPPPPPSSMELPPDQGEGGFARSPGLALMNAGLATMAAAGKRDSRGLPMSPFAAIGEGGMRGVETLKAQETAAQQRRRVDLEARRLLQQAEHQRGTLGETKRYHDILAGSRRDQLYIAAQAAAERVRHNKALEGRMGTPEQAALVAATAANDGKPLTTEQIIDITTRIRAGSRNPPSPGTPEQQAIAAQERKLKRKLEPDEIARVVQTVRTGPAAPSGELPASTILGSDDIAPNFEGATGLSGAGTNVWNKITGAFGAQAYPAEHKATRILNDLSVKTQSTLQNIAGRPSNYWLGRLETLTVKPNSWSEGPQAARDRLIQTRDTIDQEIKRVDAIVQNPQTSKTDRSKAVRSQGELRGLRADYDAVIGAWGGGAGNPLSPIGESLPAPSMGEVREGVSALPKGSRVPPRPANVPPGSKYSPSRKVWRTPDGQVIPQP